MAETINLTLEGKQKLEEELKFLKEVRRHEIIEQIKIAKGFGDLSENSEYDEARNEQAKCEGRIQELETMLKHVHVVETTEDNDSIHLGSVVTVEIEERKAAGPITYTIVGATEADYLAKKISDLSPIGKVLIGHKPGDKVDVETKAGVQHLTVLEMQ